MSIIKVVTSTEVRKFAFKTTSYHVLDSYAALYLSYDAQYDDRSQEIQCNDPANSKKGVGNQSHNICSCDRVFLTGLLHNFKKCITRVSNITTGCITSITVGGHFSLLRR